MSTDSSPNNLEPTILVLVGITGDLAERKVLPALYHLFANDLVHPQTYLVGTSRRAIPVSDILDRIERAVTAHSDGFDPAVLQKMAKHFSMLQVDPAQTADYAHLRDHLQAIEESAGVCLHRLFYLSIPPQVYGDVVQRLGENGLNTGCAHGKTTSRLLVEKPFGYNLTSAQELISKTGEHFSEEQIFRIDHYLAKETAQNILTFRQHNPLFSKIWNSRHVTGVSITAIESIGIEGRGNFYEQVGALRDLVQSHLMQLLSLTLLDVPENMTAEAIHTAKLAVLDSITPMPADQVFERSVRGQYQTYRQEVQNPDSTTETYASLVLYSQDPHWEGVPLRLTTGKALRAKRTSITIDFGDGTQTNRLQFRLQPNEGITLTLRVKKPGLTNAMEETTMDFAYHTAFQAHSPRDAYERVLIEAIRGDHLLFATDAEVLSSWRILQPLLDAWSKSTSDLAFYQNESDGPDISKLLP
jgi:glucose-6-phosphate 1-dehydrogenase